MGLPFLRRRASEVLTLEWQNFLLAYQGENDLSLQSRYSDFLASLLDLGRDGACPGCAGQPSKSRPCGG